MNKIKIIDFEDKELIDYLVRNNIYFYDLKRDNKYTSLVINYDDYNKIQIRFKSNIIKYYGKKGIINFFNIHKYMIISFIISLFFLYLLSLTIFDIEVKTDDENIKNIVLLSLKEEGIYKYKRKKSFDELKIIKEKIIKENKDKIEWIEIIEDGSIYRVEITPRVIINNKSDKSKTSIYAKKNGLIKRIVVYRGTKVKEINDYVKKGDLLISGNIYKDDKIVSKVKSDGLVYAEVWYKVSVCIPFEIDKKEYDSKIINHYYLDINGYKFNISGLYKNKYMESTTKIIIDKPYLLFDVYKETIKPYKYKKIKLSYSEALKIALNEAEKQMKEKLGDNEYIISKNILKKEVKSSKMYIEVFFKNYEDIGITSQIDKMGEKYGVSN